MPGPAGCGRAGMCMQETSAIRPVSELAATRTYHSHLGYGYTLASVAIAGDHDPVAVLSRDRAAAACRLSEPR